MSEVVVDTLTGEWRLLRADLLHDVGRSLNPAIDIGQVEGAFIQGMGWLTMEELVWHPTEPAAAADARAQHLQDPHRQRLPAGLQHARCSTTPTADDSIHRSKAVGEPPLLLPFSVFLAIRDAVSAVGGHRVDPPLQAPATPEAILRAMDAVRVQAACVMAPDLRDAAGAGGGSAGRRWWCEVLTARGSVPREAGTRMLVAADEVLGTIGGGHLELQAIADGARAAGRGGRARSSSTSRWARRSASAAAAR